MFIDIKQNSEEWFELRLKKATSSNFAKIMANDGKAFGLPALEYAERIALEYVTEVRDETGFTNAFMDRGTEFEPVARSRYELETLYVVTNGGFHYHESNYKILLGDSNDGNVGKDGCIEIKCVIPKTQWKRLKKGGYDLAYKWQIQGHIWIGEKDWCDFVSYCPEMPENKQLYIYRVMRDNNMIASMNLRINLFKEEVLKNIEILESC